MVLIEELIADLEKELTPEQQAELLQSMIRHQADSLKTDLAFAIKLARQVEGITQSQLSELTSIPQSELSRLEQKKANPTLETIAKLYVVLGIRHRVHFRNVGPDGDILENKPVPAPTQQDSTK